MTPADPVHDGTLRVLGVADSDSYVKWGAAVLDSMPAHWSTSLTIIGTPALPTERQLSSVLSGISTSVETTAVSLDDFARRVATERPDVVLLAVRGPVVRVLIRAVLAAVSRRPVFVSGLPGISIPATRKALYYRAQADHLLLHSRREVREFRALAAEMRIGQSFGLATLPFLSRRDPVRAPRALGSDIVFAPQAKVPLDLTDRRRLLGMIAETARRHPHRRVVVKLRGVRGEPQTHVEKHPFDVLIDDLERRPPNLVVDRGSMAAALSRAGGLVTVSSTAAIEAVAAGIPVIALDDFGVAPELINTVFDGSGLLASSARLLAGIFAHPSPEWLDDNYFHPAAEARWLDDIVSLVDLNDRGLLPLRPQFKGTLGGVLRRVWDRKRALGPFDTSFAGMLALAVGQPLRMAVLALRAIRRAVRGSGGPVARAGEPIETMGGGAREGLRSGG